MMTNILSKYDIGRQGLCSLETLKALETVTLSVDIKYINVETCNNSFADPFVIANPVKIAYLLAAN